MALLTPAPESQSSQFQLMKALLKHESLGCRPLQDRVLQVPVLAHGRCCREDTVVASRLAPESQGLLKVEDVALTVTPEWTQQDSSQGNRCRDEKQENHGSLVSLGGEKQTKGRDLPPAEKLQEKEHGKISCHLREDIVQIPTCAEAGEQEGSSSFGGMTAPWLPWQLASLHMSHIYQDLTPADLSLIIHLEHECMVSCVRS
ncbi:hypothetical protein H8959_010209 [Pygathrix nigripes]